MLTEFLLKTLNKARYKLLKDGNYFGSVVGLPGVWAIAKTRAACQIELREVLEEWLLLKVRQHERVPGFRLRVDRRSLVRNA